MLLLSRTCSDLTGLMNELTSLQGTSGKREWTGRCHHYGNDGCVTPMILGRYAQLDRPQTFICIGNSSKPLDVSVDFALIIQARAGRDAFAKARLDKLTPWQVYESAAHTEYHAGRDPNIATRIFQKGLEVFRGEAEYVVRYLSFLLSINDEKSKSAPFFD